MELAFLTPLLKDGANRISRGVAINNEGVLKTWLSKNGCCADGVDKGLKGRFVFMIPMCYDSFPLLLDFCLFYLALPFPPHHAPCPTRLPFFFFFCRHLPVVM